jgi:signal transduction histidine kinase
MLQFNILRKRQFRQDPLSAAVLPITLLLHLTAYLLYLSGNSASDYTWILDAFEWHFQILLALSILLSLLCSIFSNNAIFLLLFRLGLFFLLAYPLGLTSNVVLVLLILSLFEIVVYLPLIQAVGYMAGVLLVSSAIAGSGNAFYFTRDAAELHETLLFTVLTLFIGGALIAYKSLVQRLQEAGRDIGHLKSVISQLSHANLDFQRYVHSVEYSTVNSERRRISSEIHDTVGYSLTNILMTIEAAHALIDKDQNRAQQALTRAITEAQNCLEETRRSMRAMRSNELKEAVGLQAIAHLARSFSEATGMEIRVEYGNAPDSFGRELDLVLFRIIQEGLTNAFRHGQASLVKITFWSLESRLFVTILDNGRSTSKIEAGLGISGMRERIDQIGGSISFSTHQDGFKIFVELPLAEEKYEQDQSSVG